jgi:hypothetical protein
MSEGEHSKRYYLRARMMGQPMGEPLELTDDNRSYTLRSILPRLAGPEAAMLSERGAATVTLGADTRFVDPDSTTLGDIDFMFRAPEQDRDEQDQDEQDQDEQFRNEHNQGEQDQELSVNMGVNVRGAAVRRGGRPGPVCRAGF